MKYCELVEVNKNFQSSVNLHYDLNKEEKLNSYIPTQQSVSILKRYLNAIYNDNYNEDNATVLIGPYGRGKSHLLLVLSAIMSCHNGNISVSAISNLIERLSAADNATGELASMIINRDKPMLPIVVNSNHIDINQSFILAMREALERAELNDFFPETYFESAIKMIDTWEENFENAFKILKRELKVRKIKIDDLKEKLYRCDTTAYQTFCEIYPIVSNGAKFSPFQNTDVVKMYEQVSNALIEQKNYSGIYIIFDEFSKFLESTTATANMINFKLIQDFAEFAVRSNKLHICCITHKEILDYSQSDSFRTVDGRFKKLYFIASAEQSYELVANAISHKDEFENFYANLKAEFDSVSQLCHMTGLFSDITDEAYNQLLIKDCFPLHPVSIYSLIRISESVGQNERTLFTFLSQSEEFSLQSFLNLKQKKEIITFLTADWIFDYFYELFRIEVFNPKIHSIWAKTKAAINKCSNDFQRRTIKVLAICKMIDDTIFVASDTNLKAATNLNDTDYRSTIAFLTDNHIITKRRDGVYEFLTPNGVDIKNSIRNIVEQGNVRLDRPKILKEAYSTPFILPRQHNSKKRIIRHFKTTFLEANDFWNYSGDFDEFRNNADGLLIYLIVDSYEETVRISEHLNNLKISKNIIVCVSKQWEHNDLVLDYQAACLLETKIDTNDEHFKEELQMFKYDLFKSIKELADKLYSPVNPNAAYYNADECLDGITKPLLLNRELSAICDDFYFKTPIINNEMVNKNKLTPQIRNARIKAIDWILAHKDEIPIMDGFGPEVSLLRSTITVKGLENDSNSTDNHLNEVMNLISVLIEEAERKKISFDDIFFVLQSSPYGMRKGVIPVYIAYIMRKKLDAIVITYKNKEIDINGDTLSQIEENPSEYYFYTEKGTREKEDYLETIIFIFSQGITISANNQCAYAVGLMQHWFRGLSKFSRDHVTIYKESGTENVDKNIISLRKQLLQYDINPHSFLYKDIPNFLNCGCDYVNAANELKIFADAHTTFISEIKQYLISEVIKLFNSSIHGSLNSIMTDWYESLSEYKKNHIYSADVNSILHFINECNSHDDVEVISKLAKCVTMLAIEDWNDECVPDFLQSIGSFLSTINEYEYSDDNTVDDNGYVSISLDYSGSIYEKNISNTELSGIAETALSNIEDRLDEYADAISIQERISILLKLLRKEIEQI